MKTTFITIFFVVLFSACNRCKSCVLKYTENGVRSESDIGEKCGDELKRIESEPCIPAVGSCEFKCD